MSAKTAQIAMATGQPHRAARGAVPSDVIIDPTLSADV
jgi:hypothetical protein